MSSPTSRLRLLRSSGWLALILLGSYPGDLGAQVLEPAFFRIGSDTVRIVVHLDSLGVAYPPPVDATAVTTYLLGEGYDLVRILEPGTLIVTPGVPFSGSDQAIAAGTALYRDRPDLIENAGPLGRPSGYPIPLVVVDEIIVKYAEAATVQDRVSLEATFDLTEISASPNDPDRVLYRKGDERGSGFFPDLEALTQEPLVEWAYPNYRAGAGDAEVIPDDTHFGSQWHLRNGASGDINATFAWDHTLGDSDVVIAILEIRGFDVVHEDLVPNLWANSLELIGSPGMDDDGNTLVDDVHGWDFNNCNNATPLPCGESDLTSYERFHGTAVAGVAAAKGDNTQGVSGVCPECSLMLLVHGGNPWNRVHAIEYARDQGASVINGSWEGFYDALVADAIEDVVNDHGIPVVLASGNQSDDFCTGTPTVASVPEAFSVGASNREDMWRSWSNTGECLDLVAPGSELSALKGIATTDFDPGNSYNPNRLHAECSPDFADAAYTRCFGGTSASAPQVAGTIGLMLTLDPSLEPPEIYDILRQTAEKVSCADALYDGVAMCPATWTAHSDRYGYGRLDAQAAVEAVVSGTIVVDCPECDCPVCADDDADDGDGDGPSDVEVGTRLGYTTLSGGVDEDIANAPGSGPMGLAVLHVGVMTSPLMWELQLGYLSRWTGSPAVNSSNMVTAFRVAYTFTAGSLGTLFFGPDFAYQRIDSGTAVSTGTAVGAWGGRRFALSSYLSLHLEGRYRRWTSREIDEVGVSLGFAVRLP